MVNHGTVTTDKPNQPPISSRTPLARTFWEWLSSTTILGIVGGIIFLLLLCAALIRQMPGQIADDPAAATRWLLTVSEEYGILGNGLRTLGLFDVLHNPVLQLLLAVIALILFIHLGNLLATLWRFWQVSGLITKPIDTAGSPLPVPPTQPLYRLRQATAQTPSELSRHLEQMLRSHFDEVITTTVHIPALLAPTVATHPETHPPEESLSASTPTPVGEVRWLARRHHQPWIWLRPLFLMGLLLALVGVWIILWAGWEITPPLLAPGEQYRATTQRVTLTYNVFENAEGLAPTLAVEMGDTAHQVPLGQSSRLRLGQVTLAANAGPPALWIRSADTAVTLSRPGQAQNAANLGLIFPTLGSEESVVVENRVGLRIVRVAVLPEAVKASASESSNNSTDSPLDMLPHEQFLVEVYQPDEVKPVQTIVVSGVSTAKIKVSDQTRELTFVPLPSMAAAVHYQPALWLLWVALALVVIGVLGYRYQPAFLLLQLAPWPAARTVVVAQSDMAAELEQLRLFLK